VNPELTPAPFLDQALTIWRSGGWGMVALAVNGLVMFGLGMNMMIKLGTHGVLGSPEKAWRTHRQRADSVRGGIGRILDGAHACQSLEEVERYFDAVRNEEVLPFVRDLRVMKVSVSAAPLLGLLGTVTGMLATFQALATGGGGDQTMDMVAGGISEALITTETGLVLALTGLVFQFVLMRRQQRFDELIAHLEALAMQHVRPVPGEVGAV
jgi:biopolymer transport protein ExbB